MTDEPIQRAIFLEKLTIAWTAIAGAAGLIAAAFVHSVALTAFGLDSLVEMICGIVLVQRLFAEIREAPDYSQARERRAARIVGALLVLAAAYIAPDALLQLIRHRGPDISAAGIAFTLATIPIMAPIARGKSKIARAIGSRALHADAVGNAVCWYLAAIVLASLVAQAYLRVWWLDGAASLAIAAVLIVEGSLAWRGAKI